MGLATSDKCRVVQVARVHLRDDLYKLVLYARPQNGSSGLKLTGVGYLVNGSSLFIDDSSNAEKSTR